MERIYHQDDFRPIKVIGRGSTGKVMLVQDKVTGHYYALKSIRKRELPTEKQRCLARQERDLLTEKILKLSSPFLVKLVATFQSASHLFFLFEYHPGGDLASVLAQSYKLSEPATKFYAAELVLGLEALHRLKIVYRDLKPENVLIGRDGHLVLIDFGLSKSLDEGNTKTFCGTAEYLAPEVLMGIPYGFAVDLWSLGTMLYEMLTGTPPYWAENTNEMYTRIIQAGRINFPRTISRQATELINKLLKLEPSKRIGYASLSEIKQHSFFADVDWAMVGAKLLISPLRPVLESEEDVRAFDPAFTSMASNFTPAQEDTPAISSNIPNGSTLVGYHLEGFTFSGRPGHA